MQQPQTQREYWSGKVGDEWAAHAARIDVMLAPVTEAALSAAAVKPGERVLDIGCGAGATSLEIARRVGANGAVIGVDLSPQLLRVARARAAEIGLPAEFIEADAGAGNLGQDFDAAFSRFGVMFFEAPAQAFAHIRRALRDDGSPAFVCWRTLSENPWGALPISAIEPMLAAPLPQPDPDAPGPHALADGDKVRRVLTEAGWRNIALAPWDGEISIGGGGDAESIADFLMRIGPCARAINEHGLDAAEARRRLLDRIAPLHANNTLMLPAACWIVTANA